MESLTLRGVVRTPLRGQYHHLNQRQTNATMQAVEQLLEVEAKRGEGAYGPGTLAVGIARLQVGWGGRGAQSMTSGKHCWYQGMGGLDQPPRPSD